MGVLTCVLMLYANAVLGQSVLSKEVSVEIRNVNLRSALQKLEKSTGVRFIYSSRVVKPGIKVSLNAQSQSLSRSLDAMLTPVGIGYRVVDNQILLYKLPKSIKSINATSEALSLPSVREKPQETFIQGKVLDSETTTPLPGVNVVIKGTSQGTTTDIDGTFTLNVPVTHTQLVFSFVGYEKLEHPIDNASDLLIQMKQDIRSLEEMVVIGYGAVQKSDLTGSVGVIKDNQLLDRQATNVGQALQGRIPGVEVSLNSSAPGYQPRVRIRGIGSINSGIDPLYVVDGIIGVSNVNLLNPNDIESIEVLKDASATAIYGARGANGVILITTHRGKAGKTQVTYDSWASYHTPARRLGTLTADEFMLVYNTAFDNASKYDPQGYADGKYIRNNPADFPNLFDAQGQPLYSTDWEREIYRPTTSQNHEFSVRGGTDKSAQSLSLGFTDQGGIMRGSGFQRYSVKFTLDNSINNWWKVGGSIFLNKSRQQVVDDASGGLNVPRMVMEALPILPIKYPDGSWGRNKDWPGMEGGENPIRLVEERERINNRLQALGQVYSSIQLAEGLNLQTNVGYELQNAKNNFYSGRDLNALSADQKGVASITSINENYWQFENYLNYTKTFQNNHTLTSLMGLSWQERSWEMFSASSENFIDDFWGWSNLGVGTILRKPSSEDGKWSLNSYFTRLNYNIQGKYLFTFTGRYDGSSKFGANGKYGFFPSAAIAWNLSEEEFLKNSKLVSNLKLRVSYGKTGNQEIGQYASQQFLNTGDVLLDGKRQTGIWRGSFGNPDLRWEYTNQFDIGADIGLLNNRIDITLDYYHKITKDLLLNAPIPWSSGLSSVTQNIGSVENDGWEIAITSRNITHHLFSWNTNLAFSANKNKVLKLGVNNDDIFPGPRFLGETNILRVGYPIGSFWGYKRLGTWNTSEADLAARYNRQPGDLRWADLNNDGRIDANDETIIGQAYPKWTMNVSNRFQIGKFDLAFDIRFVMGVNSVNATKHSTQDRQGIASSSPTVLDAWRPDNQDTFIAEIRHYNAGYDTHMDDWWVENGAFIRGQNIILGYTLPHSLGKVHFQRLRVYASAQNFFLWDRYSGYDPEALTGFGNQLTQNIEFFQYPRPRTFNMGLNVTF